MIPKECKRLAEVDFPIAEVSKHAAGETPLGGRSRRAGRRCSLVAGEVRSPLPAA